MIVAILALITALSGSAYAALRVPQNSVGSRQLKANAVTNGKIANNAITGPKVADGSLSGADINMAALGTVPQAASAERAAEAQKLDGHEAACPPSTTLIRGLCFDSHSNPEAPNVEAAAEACAQKGGWLPTPMELYSTRAILNLGAGGSASQHQYTDDFYGTPGGGSPGRVVLVNGVSTPEEQEADKPSAYYCVYALVR
jgi:hypothetical protein